MFILYTSVEFIITSKFTKLIFISVRAAVYSFGIIIVQPWKSDARLPCKSVGKPEPLLVWKQWSQPLKESAR